ncbi:patatin-like phospholipase family protein [Pseudomonas fragi]|uniref:patatin-like phospholipase family protein n=1 Tax=Pseudomonas fragi TaxID=296 RepID=UPI000BA2219E|nr:patatin-like phospholipase family protein [Pseudomonas fragi]OZY62358.1 phospholipase [Pseudomonas fragi]
MSDGMKVGLVLSGGGAKGAYQVGVLRALRELGTQIDAVSGASIGALNGGVLASAPSLDVGIARLEELWGRLAERSPIDLKLPSYLSLLVSAGLKMYGVGAVDVIVRASRTAAQHYGYEVPEAFSALDGGLLCDGQLQSLMDEYLQPENLATGLPLYISIYKSLGGLNDLAAALRAELGFADTPDSDFVHIQSQPPKQQKDILLASAAIPLLFAPRQTNGSLYSDGGQGGWQTMQGNTPITPLIEAGCNLIIVTHLSNGSPWSRQDFPNATIVEIRPQESLSRAAGPLGGSRDLLGFDSEKIPSWIEQGYRDTMHCMNRVMAAGKSRHNLRQSEALLAEGEKSNASADKALADVMAQLK